MTAPILIVTAGDWRYKTFLAHGMAAARERGYEVRLYNLGGLESGIPWTIDDENFRRHGFYDALLGLKTTARYKPSLIQHALAANPGRFIVWLDGDAILNDSIDDIISDDYDVGIPVRKITETWRWPNIKNHAYEHATRFRTGELNAGVLFFQPTEAAAKFVIRWTEMTNLLGNDQLALNRLVNPNNGRLTGPASKRAGPFIPKILMVAGARIKTFPNEYNWRRWPREASYPARTQEARILHFCGQWGKEEAVRRGLMANPESAEAFAQQKME